MKSRFLFLGLIVGFYLVFAPYINFLDGAFYDTKRLLQVGVILTVSIILFLQLTESREKQSSFFISPKAAIVFVIFFTFGIFSVFNAFSPYAAAREVVIYLVIFLVVLHLGYYFHNDISFYQTTILAIAVIFSTGYSIYFIGNYISAHLSPMVPFWPDRLSYNLQFDNLALEAKEVLNFAHRRFFNHTQTWTFPLLLGLITYFRKKKIYYSLIFALLTIWWVLVFASGARGTTLAVFAGIGFVFIKYWSQSKEYIKNLFLSIVAGGFLYYILYSLLLPINDAGVSILRSSSSGRIDMWMESMQIFLKNPILGVGPYHYAFVETTPSFAHPHNFYIQVLAEWGVISFLSLIVFLGITLRWLYVDFDTTIEDKTPNERYLRMGFLGSIIAALLHGFVSGIFHTPMSQIWFILIASYFVAWYYKKETNVYTGLDNLIHYTKYVMIISVLGFCLFSINDFMNRDKNREVYKETFETTQLYPRFWGQGLIWNLPKED